MVEKDGLLRELDSCHTQLRKAGSADNELGLPRTRSESQQAHKVELKVKFVLYLIIKEKKYMHTLAWARRNLSLPSISFVK